jgi:glycosyltransferase involved in cell wall biosynthesis
MRVVAIIAAYNEERFINVCLEHLFANGVEAYLCDNQSTDGTVEIARRHLGSGLIGIEELPRDGTFRWRHILARKEQLALELDADWFLHLDPDEIPLPPRRDQTLAAAFAAADADGYNAVELAELTFVPTREAPDHDHADFQNTMRWYYPFAPQPQHLVRAWKHQRARVDLVSSGGHRVSFAGRQISPRMFFLRHYLFLSREHAIRKYVRKLYDGAEVRDGWHSWRASLTVEAVRLPPQSELRQATDDADLDTSVPHRQHCLLWPEQ